MSYLLQPGIPVEDAGPVTAALRSRFPALHAPHPDGFCYAASDRAETIRAIASAADVMLVLGVRRLRQTPGTSAGWPATAVPRRTWSPRPATSSRP